jgi:hypothetical protein
MSLEFNESNAERQAICGPHARALQSEFSKRCPSECDLLPNDWSYTSPQMKRSVAAISLVIAFSTISSTIAQAPAPTRPEDQTLLAVIKEVQQQQVEIAANQTKIEAKLADLAETIRIARIYTSRGR